MSAGQEIGSPIRENRTLLPAPLPPDEARGTLAAAAGVSTVGLRPPFDTPAAAFSSRLSRRSHLDCRAANARVMKGFDGEGQIRYEQTRLSFASMFAKLKHVVSKEDQEPEKGYVDAGVVGGRVCQALPQA